MKIDIITSYNESLSMHFFHDNGVFFSLTLPRRLSLVGIHQTARDFIP